MTLDDVLAPLRADPSRAAVLLDVDGTIAPIVRDPDSASVPELTRRTLGRVAKTVGLLGCVSGRPATVARRIVGMGSIPYAGNHGAELLPRGAGQATVDPEVARWTARVRAIADAAGPADLRAAGIRREDKGAIVALHWRGADNEAQAQVTAYEIAARARDAGLAVHEGRRVLELRPPVPFGKDLAVRWLLKDADVDTALYAGDDRTDADAFDALRDLVAEGRLQHAVCVGVGSDETPAELTERADVIVDGPDGVRRLLDMLTAE